MHADKIRKLYLEYFEQHGHTRLPSSSLVPNDPTLLFTSAGMVQFKDIFWGRVAPQYPRVTTCQKCFRTTDIENVGVTAFHHTFFEMLGNFSFGDYFKEGAITLAWEFLTEELAIPPERLWVSVYKDDDEAYAIWRDVIGIPPDRIARLGKKHNWWGPVGNSGPCGPDSEIFYDTGDNTGCDPNCSGVECDCDRFSEIWNLVFMQYDAQEDGSLVPLERKNIDTGMGLERTAAVLQGVKTDFETDVFAPIVTAITDKAEIKDDLISRNIIADHIRGAVFLMADGILPGNEKQGYVLRRILRRAIRAGERIGLAPGGLAELVDPVIASLGDVYPEIITARELSTQVIAHEEATFRHTLRAGERRLAEKLKELADHGEKMMPGQIAFELYDTYGFPLEMTAEIAREHGIKIDQDGFAQAMASQRARSRNEPVRTEMNSGDYALPATEFLGYTVLEAEGKLLQKIATDNHVNFVFDRTPFYAESGGQVGDTGTIENLDRPGKAEVTDVQKTRGGVFLHVIKKISGEFVPGDRCRLRVDEHRRRRIARNHTATHLLHAALRQVLGEHVIQAGSYVSPDELRFDFSHFARMSDEEIAQVERIMNEVVLANLPVRTDEMPLEEAKKTGAMAHFEEEYKGKALVRVVSVGEFSRELCGGTHVAHTGEIGIVKILSEESVASGTRRIRAVTGDGALARWQRDALLLAGLRARLGEDLLEGLTHLEEELAQTRSRLRAATDTILQTKRDELLSRAERIGGVSLISGRVDMEIDALKRLADFIEEKTRPAVVLLGGKINSRGIVVAKVSTGVEIAHAGNVVREMAKLLGGGGGGAPHFAQGGGPHAEKLEQALAAGVEFIRSGLTA